MDDLTDLLFPNSSFNKAELDLATKNYENQIELLEQLQNARLAAGLTFAEISVQLGISASLVEKFFVGQKEMHFSELRMIANVLNVKIEYVIETKPKTE